MHQLVWIIVRHKHLHIQMWESVQQREAGMLLKTMGYDMTLHEYVMY
jgi:hypothetical protein